MSPRRFFLYAFWGAFPENEYIWKFTVRPFYLSVARFIVPQSSFRDYYTLQLMLKMAGGANTPIIKIPTNWKKSTSILETRPRTSATWTSPATLYTILRAISSRTNTCKVRAAKMHLCIFIAEPQCIALCAIPSSWKFPMIGEVCLSSSHNILRRRNGSIRWYFVQNGDGIRRYGQEDFQDPLGEGAGRCGMVAQARNAAGIEFVAGAWGGPSPFFKYFWSKGYVAQRWYKNV